MLHSLAYLCNVPGRDLFAAGRFRRKQCHCLAIFNPISLQWPVLQSTGRKQRYVADTT